MRKLECRPRDIRAKATITPAREGAGQEARLHLVRREEMNGWEVHRSER